jgi:hypothetical protein
VINVCAGGHIHVVRYGRTILIHGATFAEGAKSVTEVKQLVTITTDGQITITPLKVIPKLEALRNIVGGYVEIVPYWNTYAGMPCVAFCDEDGKLKIKPHNPVATEMWWRNSGHHRDYLVGNIVIVCGPKAFLRSL